MGRNGKDNNYFKAELIANISKEYSVCLKQTSLGACRFTFNESNNTRGGIVSLMDAKKYVQRVEDTLAKLDSVEEMVIINDFFSNTNKTWWVDAYSRSTYYRIRSGALNNFLEIWKRN